MTAETKDSDSGAPSAPAEPPGLSRRQFLQRAGLLAGGAVVAGGIYGFTQMDGGPAAASGLRAVAVSNPLKGYPGRDWEAVYRDLAAEDDSFVFLCAPNDTHNCLLRAYVKNGYITRIGPSYGFGKATDLQGNRMSQRWDPRICNKGISLMRRVHGNRRVKAPMVRLGFKRWAEAGFPRGEDGRPPAKYMRRGRDTYVQVPWDEAYALSARALVNIATTYTGDEGARRLHDQGYDEAMIEAMHGAGTQSLKFRGGMAFLGANRLIAPYRLANGMALLDAKLRGVGPDEAVGARGWDSYSWHTDLPPGHPLVTGQQTNDWDLVNVEHANLVTLWGMNWITTKMPDAHFLTEARLKGTKVVVIACEYQATANKADEVLVLRNGTDTALALGMAQVVMDEGIFDLDFVQSFTDLPLLVREDNHKRLKASDIFPDYEPKGLTHVRVLKDGEKAGLPFRQERVTITQLQRLEWSDSMVWDEATGKPAAVSLEQVGGRFLAAGVRPALRGSFTVPLADGGSVRVRPLFDVLKEHLDQSYTPGDVAKITWLSADAVRDLAREIAANARKTLFACGMGPNHHFNGDLKDRAVFLIAALTANVGNVGGNVGSYAGNYRAAFFNGLPLWAVENPFEINLETDAKTDDISVKKYFKYESAHYWNYGDRPLRRGNKLFTDGSHMPTPTKSLILSNSNSIIGNAKWHYDVVMNTIPKMEFIAVADWWWTASCEYADIVFAVDGWPEMKQPDFTASVTNPFLYVWPVTPFERLYDTQSDQQVVAGVAAALADETGDRRFRDYFHFIYKDEVGQYIQRVWDASSPTAGYNFDELHAKAREGIPALAMTRTSPKTMGWEQTNEDKPWYTKTGRLEFYRDETVFLEHGENLPIHREPVDATFHEPNTLVAKPHPFIKPKRPEDWGFKTSDLDAETRQVRNVMVTADDLGDTHHPLIEKGFSHIYLTPKYRHGVHTTPADTDMLAAWFGPFGDLYRTDRRMPWVGEGYVDINPLDAKAIGIEDGDYVWMDADPADRPYRGWKEGTEEYKVARCLLRARYYPGTPPGIARTFHNMYVSTFGSVKGHEENEDGLARSPDTGYQSMYRYGAHQSATRAWLRPVLMSDEIVRKNFFGQQLGTGYEVDVYTVNGAPKESFVKFTRAEAASPDGGLWRPARLGQRPGYESEARKTYMAGGFVRRE